MTSPRSDDSKRREMRKRLLILALSVVALHSAAIGVYYGMHVGEKTQRTQQTFIAVWLVATLGLVTTQMRRIRALRRPAKKEGRLV